ncbi:hypothetical protein ABVV53_11385 [Novosphingobium sp. RD2P27]|uniref:TonB-dependent receptor n=1 Tax=Novosphingobium kalidii TaxID=3230299 RepID=A0ABV2D2H5_9SPHN
MIRTTLSAALASAALLPMSAQAQMHDHSMMNHPSPAPTPEREAAALPTSNHHAMPGMDHGSHTTAMPESGAAYAPGSGTARLPGFDAGIHGLHITTGDWMLMAHGYVSSQFTDHSGPRGDDKFYVTSMAMLTAERETAFGRVQLRSMASLEPAMSARGYPNLFATGETANGEPLVDRQHPHDLFMELAARVDFDIGAGTRAFLYGGPVGEPALGPTAFMMRRSARLNPEPPITHHWFDSTHITYGVVTAGLATDQWQIEASAFRGAEPDEERWNIETPKLDSWSVRATWTPQPTLAVQASYAQIQEPEATHPGEDEHRFTASAHYASPNGLSAMAAVSSKNRIPGNTLTAWLAEANWDLDRANTLFGRVENVANDELFPDHHDPLHDRSFRVTKLQAGYARRFALKPFELALGGSLASYIKPDALDTAYGDNPWGYTLFARLTLGG